MARSKVSDKSTKGEIWEAYKQLLQEAQARPVSVSEQPARLEQMTTALLEAKAGLLGQFDTTIERLGTITQAYVEADQDLNRRKTAMLEAVERDQQQLQANIEATRKQWKQEEADRDLQRQREDDTYTYNLTRKRRDEQESYDQKIKEREAGLTARESAVAEQESQIEELTKQVNSFPKQLEEVTKSAAEAATKQLKTEHQQEIKDLKQQSEHEKSILSLKLQTAETTINSQTKQLSELQRQLDAASSQLKEMAVTVIQAKNAQTPMSQQT